MRLSIVRPRALQGAALLVLAACGPSDVVGKDKLDPISEGMLRDSLLPVLGPGPFTATTAADSMRLVNGHRTQVYMVGGQQYRVIWYREAAGTLEDSISRQTDTPILLRGDTVMGRGWAYFDEKSAEVGIPNPLAAGARIDSIARSQQAPPPQP